MIIVVKKLRIIKRCRPNSIFSWIINGAITDNNVTINKEQYSSSIEKEDLLILNLCNDLREKRFGLEALDTDENIQPIRVVLEKFEFKDIERVAKYYFNYAKSEFMTPYFAFKLEKIKSKIQSSKDHYTGRDQSNLFDDISLTTLINQGKKWMKQMISSKMN